MPVRHAQWWAPGRVTLIGDHTDYTGGLVLPFAIPQGTTVDVTLDDTGYLTVHSTRYAADVHQRPLSELPRAAGGWASYVDGAVQLLRTSGVAIDGVTARVSSDLPLGAGLSSSAALVCATVSALLDAMGQECVPGEIAAMAQRVENEYVGAPVGFMDPAVVMLAEDGHALLVDCRSREVSAVPLDVAADELVMLVIDTGERHATRGSTYAERVAQCQSAATQLGVSSLRDVDDVTTVERIDDPLLRARARHVVTENARVRAVLELLHSGRICDIGPLLLASHQSLRDDYGVSTYALDLVVNTAMDAGAMGARLTGAGMGGCALVLTEHARAASTRVATQKALRDKGYPAPMVMVVEPGPGARRTGRDLS